MAGCGAVGSALRSGRRGRRFESCHPDKCGERGCSKTIEQPFFIANFLIFFSRCKIFLLPLQAKNKQKRGASL